MVNSLLSGKTLRAAVAIPYYYPDHYVEDAGGRANKIHAQLRPRRSLRLVPR